MNDELHYSRAQVLRGMEGHNIPARLRQLKQQQAAKRAGSSRVRPGANQGILASIAVKGPMTKNADKAQKMPAAPAPVVEVSPAEPPPPPTAEEVKAAELAAKGKKLFQHRI